MIPKEVHSEEKSETFLAENMFLLIYPLLVYWCVRDMDNGGSYDHKSRTVFKQKPFSGFKVLLNMSVPYL